MDFWAAAWALSLLLVMVSLPMAAVRAYAYFSGERDHTRTMRIAMTFSVVVAAIAVTALIVLTIVNLAQ